MCPFVFRPILYNTEKNKTKEKTNCYNLVKRAYLLPHNKLSARCYFFFTHTHCWMQYRHPWVLLLSDKMELKLLGFNSIEKFSVKIWEVANEIKKKTQSILFFICNSRVITH